MKKTFGSVLGAIVVALTLAGCGGTSGPLPTPTVTQPPVPQPSVTVDPNKYTFAATSGPNVQFGLQLLRGTKFIDQKLTTGVLNTPYGNCGVVFVDRKTITADHLLTTVEQVKQSDNWITEYAKRVGAAPSMVGNGNLTTTEPRGDGGTTYSIATREATFESSRYNGILESRVFPDGTGLALAILCRTGVTVPDVLVNARITTQALPSPASSPSPSATLPLPTVSTPQVTPSVGTGAGQ